MQPMQPPLPPASVDHQFPPRDLAMRFRRPSSSMGYRQASGPYEYEASPEGSVARRSSMSRKASKEIKDYEDRKRMPPPARPKLVHPDRAGRLERAERAERLERQERVERQERQERERQERERQERQERERQDRPERIILKPQPMLSSNRKSVVFDDDDLDDDESTYHTDREMLRRGSGVEYGSSPFKNRRQSFDAASESVFTYEDDEDEDDDSEDDEEEEEYFEERAPRSRSRRRSHVGIEDKIRDASRYQDHIGSATSALTAEALRKVKTSGSSRSTQSSDSRDESEYRHSATTHTTRSSNEDDITIKVSAGCVVEVGNVKIHSGEGGEISVGRGGPARGSDRTTSIYGDDRRSRSGRSTRTRASSQAAYARGLPAPSSYAHSPLSEYGHDDDDSVYG